MDFDIEEDQYMKQPPQDGDCIDVYWPMDDERYPGKIASINTEDNTYDDQTTQHILILRCQLQLNYQ